MIYKEKPQTFNSKFEVISCFVEHGEEILLLHRQDHKPEGNTWGVPAGKIDVGEEPLEAMIRELREETRLKLDILQLFYFGKVFVKYTDYDFIYHIYHTQLEQKQEIIINPKEHKNFKWITPQKALGMNLIQDLDECIKLFYRD
jgi:8-oxo-dGTP pyrophosphatase MutT (NUDIX family)